MKSSNMKNNSDEVAVFWDYENCPAPTNTSGYSIVDNIRSVAQTFGSITLFKAYLEVSEHVPVSRALLLRSELQSSGVSLTDCPHNGRKDVADKMIIVDMLAHAIDKPAPSTILLISGDRDFAYALSILRLRRYHIILITLSNAHPSLRAQASVCFDWNSEVLGPVDPTSLHQPTSPRRGKSSIPPAHNIFHSDTKGHNPLKPPFQDLYDEKPASSVEFINTLQDNVAKVENTLPCPKRGFGPDLLPPELEPSKRRPSATSCTASSTLRNGPDPPARVIYSPVTSSLNAPLNGTIETPLTMTSHDSNSSQSSLSSNASTPKLAPYGSIMASRFSAHISLRGSTSLPNLMLEDEVGNVTEPGFFEPTMQTRTPPAEPNLRGPSTFQQQQPAHFSVNTKHQGLSTVQPIHDHHHRDTGSSSAYFNIYPPTNVGEPVLFEPIMQTRLMPVEPHLRGSSTFQQQTVHPSVNTKPQGLLTVRPIGDQHGNTDSSSAHTNIYPPTNVVTPLRSSAPSFMMPSPLGHTPISTAAQSSANPPPPPPPVVADKFKILVECLKTHRSKGNLRPSRSVVAIEIGRNGTTYRQAGVTKFRDYTAMAEKAGIVEVGGSEGTAWIGLAESLV